MKKIKNIFSKMTEKTIAILMAVSLLLNNFMPLMNVLAATWDETKNYNEYYQIQLNNYGNENIATDSTNVVITYNNGRVSINGEDLTIKDGTLYSKTNMTVESVTPSDNYNYEIWYEGGQINLDTLNTNLSSLDKNKRKNVDFNFEEKQSGKLTFNGATSISGSETTMTVSYEHGTVTVTGNDLETSSDDGGKYIYSYNVPQSLSITATPEEGYQTRINGNLVNNFNQSINANDNINLNINFEGNNQQPQQQTNKTATMNIDFNTSGTYEHEGRTKNFEENGDIAINGFMLKPGDTTLNYYLENDATTVTFNFSSLWHLKYYDSIVINGTTYNVSLDYDNQKDWLDNYNGQIVGFDIPNVPVADTYNISVKVGRQQTDHIANFLWTGDPNQEYEKGPDGNFILDENGKKVKGHNYIGNAHLEMVGLEYTVGGQTYTYDEDDFKSGSFDKDYVEYDSDESLSYDEGSLVIPAGSKVTMRITPKYGYQVLSSNFATSGITTTDDKVNEFTFTIGGGAAYFNADVVKYDDLVDAESEKVLEGNIELADGTLESGNAKLTVSDIDLDEATIEKFNEASGDYSIKSYLDINLYQINLRGTEDSYWDDQRHTLDDYATITLKLADGIDGNDIVIVHNIDNGDKFEIIKTEYDSKTNTITFKTKSFSNYAIASKTTESTNSNETTTTNNSSNPQTGDNIRMYINLFILSAGGLAIATLQLKKRRKLAKNN